MPKSLRADIEWVKTRIAFYTQAVEELSADQDAPDETARLGRIHALQMVIADLRRALTNLEQAFAAEIKGMGS